MVVIPIQGRAGPAAVIAAGLIVALALSLLWLLAVIGLITRAFGQRDAFQRLITRRCASADAPHVAIVVPARDEARNIEICLTGLTRQRYPVERLQIIVVDDDSSDDTAARVRTMAERHPHIRLIRSPPLPPGWNGKVNACAAGAAAVTGPAEWLCFIDADIRTHPLVLASAVRAAAEDRIDCLSLSPRHELGSFAERLMIPCGHYLLSFSQNLAQVQAADNDEVVATGQFMLLRREAYDRIGGYAAVADAICEDTALARRMKHCGQRVLLQDGSKLLTTRMYTGWRTLWLGFAKNLIEVLGGPAATVSTAVIAVALAWAAVLLPLIDAVGCVRGTAGACTALVPAAIGSAAAFGFHLAGSVYFGIPFWYGLLFPFAYSAGALLALDSLWWRFSGRVRWKGRVYQ